MWHSSVAWIIDQAECKLPALMLCMSFSISLIRHKGQLFVGHACACLYCDSETDDVVKQCTSIRQYATLQEAMRLALEPWFRQVNLLLPASQALYNHPHKSR